MAHGGGASFWAQASPTHPPTIFLKGKTKFVKGAGNMRPTLGIQTFFWPLTHSPTRGVGSTGH